MEGGPHSATDRCQMPIVNAQCVEQSLRLGRPIRSGLKSDPPWNPLLSKIKGARKTWPDIRFAPYFICHDAYDRANAREYVHSVGAGLGIHGPNGTHLSVRSYGPYAVNSSDCPNPDATCLDGQGHAFPGLRNSSCTCRAANPYHPARTPTR